MRLSRREKGEGQMGCLVGLILLALAGFISYKIIPVKVRVAELRQVVVDEAKSAGSHSDDRIRRAILEKAREDDLPITEESIQINRHNSEITVQVDYVVPIEFPGYTYKMHVSNEANNPIF